MKSKLVILSVAALFSFVNPVFAAELPTNPVILAEQGQLFYSKRNYEEALIYFTQIPQDKRDDHITLLMANCYQSLNNETLAVDILKGLISKNPANYHAYYNLGTIFLKNKDYTNAQKCFELAVKAKKDFYPGYYNLGVSLYEQQKYKDAYKNFKKALKIDNNKELVHQALEAVCQKLGKTEEAKKYSVKP